MLGVWLVFWDKAGFVAWGMLLEHWLLDKGESKSGIHDLKTKNTDSESFRDDIVSRLGHLLRR